MSELIRAEVWLLGKCDFCGTPLDHVEREGTTVWHFHEAPAGPASGMPRPPAEKAARGSTADSRPETRTGVSETPSEAHVCEVPDVDGWTLSAYPGGIVLSHDTEHRPVLTCNDPIPLGAVLAFIADQEGQGDER